MSAPSYQPAIDSFWSDLSIADTPKVLPARGTPILVVAAGSKITTSSSVRRYILMASSLTRLLVP